MVILSNTLSSSLIPHIKHCNTTKEMWNTLEKIFSNVSSARKMQLKEKLQNVKMDRNMTIMDYVGKIRKIVDDLALIDCMVDDDDIVRVCLKGMPSNFNIFKTSIYVVGIPSFDVLIPKLLQEEQITSSLKSGKD